VSVEREFVSLEPAGQARAGAGGRPCQGVFYRPSGKQPTTALIATHYDVDFSEHYLADFMAERGYGFLGWNTRYRGLGTYFSLENAVVDIGAGVRWLREEAGIERLVIVGNSGGASLMSAYQSQAEGRDRADLFVSLCAHLGRPDVLTLWLDPSVTDEFDPLGADPALDMFNPDNGPPYSPEFVERYRAAQVDRNDRITAWCKAELQRLAEHGAFDRVFPMYRAWADLRFLDLALDPSDRETGCYFGDPKFANYSPFNLGVTNTCRSWLNMWSLSESNCRAGPHLAKVTEPALVVQSTGDKGCFPSDARMIHDGLASSDKRLEFVPGDHYLQTPASARDDVADLIAAWLAQH